MSILEVFTSEETTKWLKSAGLAIVILTGLYGLAQAVYAILDPTWLVIFFAVLRRALLPFDFFFNTTLLLQLLGYYFVAWSAIWVLKAYIYVAHFFKSK